MGGASSKSFYPTPSWDGPQVSNSLSLPPITNGSEREVDISRYHQSMQSPRYPPWSIPTNNSQYFTGFNNLHISNKPPNTEELNSSMTVNDSERNHSTHIVPCNDDLNIVRTLLGAKVNIAFGITDTTLCPLFIACHHGLVDLVQRLLVNGGCDIHSPDINGCTPLYIACYKGHFSIVQLLLSHNVDINVGKPPFSPLYAASKNGHVDIVELLLSKKANLYLQDNDRLLAYDVAANFEIRQLLLQAHESYGHGLCAICWEEPVHNSFAFVPCGHNIVCRSCNDTMQAKYINRCPMCREEIWCRTTGGSRITR